MKKRLKKKKEMKQDIRMKMFKRKRGKKNE